MNIQNIQNGYPSSPVDQENNISPFYEKIVDSVLELFDKSKDNAKDIFFRRLECIEDLSSFLKIPGVAKSFKLNAMTPSSVQEKIRAAFKSFQGGGANKGNKKTDLDNRFDDSAKMLYKTSMNLFEKEQIKRAFSAVSSPFCSSLALLAKKLCEGTTDSKVDVKIVSQMGRIDGLFMTKLNSVMAQYQSTVMPFKNLKKQLSDFSQLCNRLIEDISRLFVDVVDDAERLTVLENVLLLVDRRVVRHLFEVFSDEMTTKEKINIIAKVTSLKGDDLGNVVQFIFFLNASRSKKMSYVQLSELLDFVEKYDRKSVLLDLGHILVGDIPLCEIVEVMNSLKVIPKVNTLQQPELDQELRRVLGVAKSVILYESGSALVDYPRRRKILENLICLYRENGKMGCFSLGLIGEKRSAEEINVIISSLYSFNGNRKEREDVAACTNRLVTSDMTVQEICAMIEAVAAIPKNNRESAVDYAVPFLKSIGKIRNAHFIVTAMASILESEPDSVIKYAKQLLKDDWKASEVALILQAIASISEHDRENVIASADSFLKWIQDASGVSCILKAIAQISESDRDDVINRSIPLIEKEDANGMSHILLAMASIEKSDRANIITHASPLFVERISGAAKGNIMKALAEIPKGERREVIAFGRQLCPEIDACIDKLFASISTILKKDRKEVIKLTKSLIKEEMRAYQKVILLSAVKQLSKTQITKVAKNPDQLFQFDEKLDIDWGVFFEGKNSL